MSRKWHVEHADWREWDEFELNDIAERELDENDECEWVLVDQFGVPWMIAGTYGDRVIPLEEEEDMAVVWDD